jgi:hypothetical protein
MICYDIAVSCLDEQPACSYDEDDLFDGAAAKIDGDVTLTDRAAAPKDNDPT